MQKSALLIKPFGHAVLVLGSYALLALMVNSFDVDLPPDRKESVMPV